MVKVRIICLRFTSEDTVAWGVVWKSSTAELVMVIGAGPRLQAVALPKSSCWRGTAARASGRLQAEQTRSHLPCLPSSLSLAADAAKGRLPDPPQNFSESSRSSATEPLLTWGWVCGVSGVVMWPSSAVWSRWAQAAGCSPIKSQDSWWAPYPLGSTCVLLTFSQPLLGPEDLVFPPEKLPLATYPLGFFFFYVVPVSLLPPKYADRWFFLLGFYCSRFRRINGQEIKPSNKGKWQKFPSLWPFIQTWPLLSKGFFWNCKKK